MKLCTNCNKTLSRNNQSGLCQECLREKQKQDKIQHWLKTGDTGIKVATTLRSCIRDYIYKEQNYNCAICGIENSWNNQQLNFILDHIDGDASNNSKDNLRLICPNCDAQLPTYKSKNKNSARIHRHTED